MLAVLIYDGDIDLTGIDLLLEFAADEVRNERAADAVLMELDAVRD